MINILTVEMLNEEHLARTTPAQNMEHGRADFEQGCATIESVQGPTARLLVRDHRNNHPYQVLIWMNYKLVALT